jgi:hypothetical protein
MEIWLTVGKREITILQEQSGYIGRLFLSFYRDSASPDYVPFHFLRGGGVVTTRKEFSVHEIVTNIVRESR